MSFHPCYLSTWLKKEPGALLVDMERAQLKRVLKPILGDYYIQIGGLPELAEASPIRFKWFFNTQSKSDAIQVSLDELPLLPHSVDVIALIHVLEFTPEPQVLLQEAYQALVPGGQLIIVCLNPWSLWGLKHRLTHDHDFPWNGHFWSSWRVKDWLRHLGLRIVNSDTFCFRPPLKKAKWWQRLLWMEAFGSFCFPSLGGFFLVTAQKRTVGMTPIKEPAWSKKEVINASGLEPTARTASKCQNYKP